MARDEDSYIGKQIGGDYRIITKINRGAYGTVYKAQHLVFDDIVAIKLLWGLVESESDQQQFFQEARLLRQLRHPHILPILGAGIHDEKPYIVMEYAAGGSLKDRMKQQSGQPLPQQEALTILKQIGEALHYAHQQNVVHRDLKPDNILFNAKGEALLADFGIAAILTSGTKDLGRGGTPIYMAPEQFEGKASTKSDQYALGCIAYELFTGHKPFDLDGAGMEVVWYHHTKVIPASPKQHNSYLPDNIAQAILTALAKQRTERYADIPTFIAAVSTQKTSERRSQERTTPQMPYNPNDYQQQGGQSYSPPAQPQYVAPPQQYQQPTYEQTQMSPSVPPVDISSHNQFVWPNAQRFNVPQPEPQSTVNGQPIYPEWIVAVHKLKGPYIEYREKELKKEFIQQQKKKLGTEWIFDEQNHLRNLFGVADTLKLLEMDVLIQNALPHYQQAARDLHFDPLPLLEKVYKDVQIKYREYSEEEVKNVLLIFVRYRVLSEYFRWQNPPVRLKHWLAKQWLAAEDQGRIIRSRSPLPDVR